MDLNWADKDSAIRFRNFENKDFVLIKLHIADVFSKCHRDFALDVNSEDGGENKIGNRLGFAKEHFTSGFPMDLPEIGYNTHWKTIDFDNGRHRTLAAYQLGEEYVPAFVSKDSVELIKQLVRHKPLSYSDIENKNEQQKMETNFINPRHRRGNRPS